MSRSDDNKRLQELQRVTFDYFRNEINRENGLVADSTKPGSVSSIAATGMALTAWPLGMERGFLSRGEAVDLTLAALRFFRESRQGREADATGYRGFYYHFLDMDTGRRAMDSELSTIDTAILVTGMLAAAAWFDGDNGEEAEIRSIADQLYRRVDWEWALSDNLLIRQGWKPEGGFEKHEWEGYNEALILYVLALASPDHPIPEESYERWASTYNWEELYGIPFLFASPLFIHQYSHIWIDFREIRDRYMREKGIDYFENSRRATLIQQKHAVDNPKGFREYGEHCWGFTACTGPGPAERSVDGREYRFYGYKARGVPEPDDGTIAPWAAVASLPFAPDIVLPTLEWFEEVDFGSVRRHPYGFKETFNPSFILEDGHPENPGVNIWVSTDHYGINEGAILLMIENHRSGLIWRLTRRCGPIREGLQKAGFEGGWLET